ncbi:MerR family transcriptional regulator [Nonomuraea roseola]|uniref:MerR family transcriptional regulator n=1 Tax=Nonomuraea roseola TaxID=46179 RepID=A0ABV5Q1J1_9ACTN
MRIGELARRTGVSERSLRYYEEQGLLHPERTAGGHREFPSTAVETVVRIQELFAAGLCSAKIVQFLPCMGEEGRKRATPLLVEDLLVERERINRMIKDLARSRDVLDQVITEARDTVGDPS